MLTEAVSAFRQGNLSQTQVARLSDLSRANARELAAAWESIPEENRINLVRRFDELSEERVELNFGRALKVALNDQSAVVRQLAVAGLWEDESSELLDRLRDILENDESPDVRAQAAAALERFASKAVVGSLDESVASDLRDSLRKSAIDAAAPYAVQRRALESLGPYAADAEISSLISEAFESEDHGLQCSALYAMGRIRNGYLRSWQSSKAKIPKFASRRLARLGCSGLLTPCRCCCTQRATKTPKCGTLP
jgi:hypothetical protein